MREWARANVPLVDIDFETHQFCDYWRSKAANATKLDWLGTWRVWMRSAQSRLPANRYAPAGNGSRAVRETEAPGAYVHSPAPPPASLLKSRGITPFRENATTVMDELAQDMRPTDAEGPFR